MQDFSQQLIVDCIHANAITERQGSVEGVSLNVRPDVELDLAVAAVLGQIPDNTVALEIKHRIIVSQSRSSKCRAGRFTLLTAGIIPRRRSNGESLSTANDTVKCVQCRAIYDGVLVSKEHFLAVFKGVNHHCPLVAELDLEDGLPILAPPLFTDTGVILAKLQEVAKNRNSTRDLR